MKFQSQSTYRGRDEIGRVHCNFVRDGNWVKGGTPQWAHTLISQGWFFHHDGMYAKNRQSHSHSPLCVYCVLCGCNSRGPGPDAILLKNVKRRELEKYSPWHVVFNRELCWSSSNTKSRLLKTQGEDPVKFSLKGTGSPDALGHRDPVWIDLGLNKCRGWFMDFLGHPLIFHWHKCISFWNSG
jgi:hypothetical protein